MYIADTNVSVDYEYMGYGEYFTVPSGVTSITFTACGGKGGKVDYYNVGGGKGGCIKSNVVVTAGEVLEIRVGNEANARIAGYNGGGDGGLYVNGGVYKYGGGGGGATSVSRVSGDFLVVAGGGGGGMLHYIVFIICFVCMCVYIYSVCLKYVLYVLYIMCYFL